METKSSVASDTRDIVIKILLDRLDQRESSPNQFPLPVNTLGSSNLAATVLSGHQLGSRGAITSEVTRDV